MLHTAAALAAKFAKRHPNLNQVGSLSAAADSNQVGSIEAAGFRSFSATSKLVVVKAVEHFLVTGPTVISAGECVELQESDAKELVRKGKASIATAAEIADAQKKGSK